MCRDNGFENICEKDEAERGVRYPPPPATRKPANATWVPLENAFVYYDGGPKQVTIPEGFFLDKERKVGDKTVMALVRTRDKL